MGKLHSSTSQSNLCLPAAILNALHVGFFFVCLFVLQCEHTTDHKRTQFFNITQLGQKTLRLQKDGSFFPVCNTQTAELWQFKGNMKNSDMVSTAALKG